MFTKKMRKKMVLMNIFKSTGMYTTIKHKDVKVYPHIIDVDCKEEKDTYVFRLPVGYSPEALEKNFFIFEQVYGRNVFLSKKQRTHILEVYHRTYDGSYPYNLSDWPLKGKLPIIVGKNLKGQYKTFDMVKNPHLLIGGSTGGGKSTALRAVLTTLLTEFESRVTLYLSDLKRAEFHVFRNVKSVHSISYEKRGLMKQVKLIEKEMQERAELLETFGVEHVDNLPDKFKRKYIILCVDEFVLIKKEQKIMEIIENISCVGRAYGVFLILSMQRPDAKVMDGQLKNNMTVRMAFKLSNKRNSDIVLGEGSEENAAVIEENEQGRLIFKMGSKGEFLQAPLLEMEDAKVLLDPYRTFEGEIVNDEPGETNPPEPEPIPSVKPRPDHYAPLPWVEKSDKGL